jgi:uncharacterized membrane protein YkvA (DUF1232 family)
VRTGLIIVAAAVAGWVAVIAVLALVRPKGIDLAAAKRVVPDVLRLLRDLAKDRTAGRRARLTLFLLLGYLAIPIDLVPDFIPVLGYADDVIVGALALRAVVRHAGPEIVERHWRGTPDGLALVRRLSGIV